MAVYTTTDTRLLTISILSFFVLSMTGADTPSRRLITKLNPDLPKDFDCEGGLAYVKAEGEDDTLHYLITSVGTPTVLVLKTTSLKNDVESEVMVDWTKLVSKNLTESVGAISLSPKVTLQYSYGIMFTKNNYRRPEDIKENGVPSEYRLERYRVTSPCVLISCLVDGKFLYWYVPIQGKLFQYNDTRDKADVSSYGHDSTAWDIYDLKSATWQNLAASSSNDLIILKVVEMSGNHTTVANGSLQIQFRFFDHADRSKDMPHLEYNEDVSQFDFLLSDINTGDISMARYAVETVMFSTDPKQVHMKIQETKSIDDEFSPGVFTMNNWLTKPGNQDKGGYLQWKPVCYTKSSRTRADATSVKKGGLFSADTLQEFVEDSIVYDYFKADLNQIVLMASNFSFGLSKDGTFTKTNYTVWTGTLGYGEPFKDQVSNLVIGVISAGLGLPVIIIIFGGVFVCVKKKLATRTHQSSFSQNSIN